MKKLTSVVGAIIGTALVLGSAGTAFASGWQKLAGSSCTGLATNNVSVSAAYSGVFIQNPNASAAYAICPLPLDSNNTYTNVSAGGIGASPTYCLANVSGTTSDTYSATYFGTTTYNGTQWNTSFTVGTSTGQLPINGGTANASLYCYLPQSANVNYVKLTH